MISVDFADTHDVENVTWPKRSFWGPNSRNIVDQEKLLGDNKLYSGCTSARENRDLVLHYPGWGVFQYLPLQLEDGGYATALTVYWTFAGTIGVVSHYGLVSARVVGKQRRGCSTHFYFRPDERVTFVAFGTRKAGPRDSRRFKDNLGPHLLVSARRKKKKDKAGGGSFREEKCNQRSAAIGNGVV